MVKRLGIIPAAGKGTRFGELSNRYPKCCLPFNNKPILIHNIEWLLKNGCDEVVVVVDNGREQILDILDFYKFPNVSTFSCDSSLGPGVSVALGATVHFEADELLILLSDLIPVIETKPEWFEEDFLSYHEVEDTSRWCCFDSIGKVFLDKVPHHSFKKALNGVYFIKDADSFRSTCHDVMRSVEYFMSSTDSKELQISHLLDDYFSKKGEWFKEVSIPVRDFGTLQEFLDNRYVSISRSFNTINKCGSIVMKSSRNCEKLYKEYSWMKNAPAEFQPLIPKLYGSTFSGETSSEIPFYQMEAVQLPTLKELFVFLDNSEKTWDTISNNLLDLINKFKGSSVPSYSNSFWEDMFCKFEKRISQYPASIEPLPKDRVEHIKEVYLRLGRTDLTFYHGDLCFSNIFYDANRGTFKLIDPRGEYFGSWVYDLAKLTHSFMGMYDIVDSEMYIKKGRITKLYVSHKYTIARMWSDKLDTFLSDDHVVTKEDVYLVTASLFWSMIPLHSHNELNQMLFRQIGDLFYEAVEHDHFPMNNGVFHVG